MSWVGAHSGFPPERQALQTIRRIQEMKRLGLLLLAITLMLAGNAFAQNVGDNSVYFVTYYSNANTAGAPDAVVRIVNDGSGYAIDGTLAKVGVAGRRTRVGSDMGAREGG